MHRHSIFFRNKSFSIRSITVPQTISLSGRPIHTDYSSNNRGGLAKWLACPPLDLTR